MRACSTAWMAPGRRTRSASEGKQLGRDGEPHGLGDELLRGQVELLGAQHLVAARPSFWKATTRLVTAIWPRCRDRGPWVVCRLSLMMRVSVSRRGSV